MRRPPVLFCMFFADALLFRLVECIFNSPGRVNMAACCNTTGRHSYMPRGVHSAPRLRQLCCALPLATPILCALPARRASQRRALMFGFVSTGHTGNGFPLTGVARTASVTQRGLFQVCASLNLRFCASPAASRFDKQRCVARRHVDRACTQQSVRRTAWGTCAPTTVYSH
jgi:hypothetical protein